MKALGCDREAVIIALDDLVDAGLLPRRAENMNGPLKVHSFRLSTGKLLQEDV